MKPRIKIDEARMEVFVHDREIVLRRAEWRVLLALVKSNRALHRNEIGEALGYEPDTYARRIDQHIASLRAKLNGARDAIRTVQGHGYKAMPVWFDQRI